MFTALLGARSSHTYFHLIVKIVLGDSVAIYSDDEAAEAPRGEVTPWATQLPHGRTGILIPASYWRLFAPSSRYHLTGSLHYMVGST